MLRVRTAAGMTALLGLAGCWRASRPAPAPFSIVRVSPAEVESGDVLLLNDSVTVHFSAALDPLSVTTASFSVLDQNGNPVPGTVGGTPTDAVPYNSGEGGLFNILASPFFGLQSDFGIEGLGVGYAEKRVRLAAADGAVLDAFLYCATRIDAALAPFAWYQAHVLAGARQHGLPADYVRAIEAVTVIDDPDPARARRELAIY